MKQRNGRRAAGAPRYLARRLATLVIALVVIGLLGSGGWYVGTSAAAPLPPALVSSPPLEIESSTQAPDIDLPDYGAGAVAALGYDVETGLQDPEAPPAPLISFGPDEPLPIASIAKVVTALMVIDARPLDGGDGETITFTADDVRLYQETVAQGGSNAAVTAGLEMSARDALTLMLLPSANNYAASMATWAYGSYDNFLQTSRSWLDERGLEDTTMADASGLDGGTVSTPTDLVRIGQLVVADPDLSSIVAESTATVPGVGTVDSTNAVLGRAGIDGIKTGTTSRAGSCLLFSFDHEVDGETVTMVGAIVGAPSRQVLNRDLLQLIPSFNEQFSTVDLLEQGESVATLSTPWGEQAEVLATSAASVRAWGPVAIETDLVAAPVSTVEQGDLIGDYQLLVNGHELTVPVRVSSDLTDPGLGWRMSHRDQLG